MKRNIYQKLHDACLSAKSVKKGAKANGMHFNPLLHDNVQAVATQALLDNGLYATCNYLTEIVPNIKQVMVVCTMRVYDVDDPTQHILIDGCSSFGDISMFGTGQAMSYSRKYAFLNLLNLKTGIKDDDGYEPKSFEEQDQEYKKIPKSNGKKNIKLDMEELDMGRIKNDIQVIDDIYALRKWRKANSDLFDSNNKSLREYRQLTDLYETHETKLNQGVITNG